MNLFYFFKTKQSKAQGAVEYLLTVAGMMVISVGVMLALSSQPSSVYLPKHISDALCAPYPEMLCSTADPDDNPNYYLCQWDETSSRCVAKPCSSFSSSNCPTDQHCKIDGNSCVPLYAYSSASSSQASFSFEEKISETHFSALNDTSYFATTALSNSNFVIVYPDSSDKEKFVIYNANGSQVLAPKELVSYRTRPVAATTLKNGNFVIAYADYASRAYFKIFDSSENQVKAETQFTSSLNSNAPLSGTTLENGNFAFSYRGSDNNTFFVIYDQSGNQVKAETKVSNSSSYTSDLVSLSNGNLMIAYNQGNTGYFKIFDSSGNLVKDATVFTTNLMNDIRISRLSNSNIVIIYRDTSGKGNFVIYDQTGQKVKDSTPFSYPQVSSIGLESLDSGYFVITYRADMGPEGYLEVYNPDGTIKKDKTLFTNNIRYAGYELIHPIKLTNGDCAIPYAHSDLNGYFVIWG